MKTLAAKIEATLNYTAFFNFPLTGEEIWRWLFTAKPVSRSRVQQTLDRGDLPRRLKRFYTPKLSPSRRYRARTSQKKLTRAHQVGKVLDLIPGVRLVALTGSAAVGNSRAGDDLDLMLVTAAGRLWLVRPLVVLMTELLFQRRRPQQGKMVRDAVCLNLWLDETALAVPFRKRNSYTARETLQLIPLVNKGAAYEAFLAANSWVSNFLANGFAEKQTVWQIAPATRPGPSVWAPLNRLAYNLQYRYMKTKITKETVNLHSAYFHPHDWHESLQSHLNKG